MVQDKTHDDDPAGPKASNTDFNNKKSLSGKCLSAGDR